MHQQDELKATKNGGGKKRFNPLKKKKRKGTAIANGRPSKQKETQGSTLVKDFTQPTTQGRGNAKKELPTDSEGPKKKKDTNWGASFKVCVVWVPHWRISDVPKQVGGTARVKKTISGCRFHR